MQAKSLYQLTFFIAGLYNLAFGVWAGFFPHLYFEWLDLELPKYPEFWACLGMVVGIYGFLYLYAAFRLDRAKPIIACGLLGKVLGPIGMLLSLSQGENLPERAIMLCVYNDFIWWLPFGYFLIHGTSLSQKIKNLTPMLCAGIHLIALIILAILIQPGSPLEEDHHQRAVYILENKTTWRLSWFTWMISAVSLIGFYAWWAQEARMRTWGVIAIFIAWLGMICDISGEMILSFVLPDLLVHAGVEDHSERVFSLLRSTDWLMAFGANGLYTLGGIILTVNTKNLSLKLKICLWIVWLAGIGMSLSAALDYLPGIVLTTAILFPLFIVVVLWLEKVLRSRPDEAFS